jgi:hypothetical protein
MHISTSAIGAAGLLALVPTVLAVGSASVYNNCDFDVYYAAISGEAESMQLLGAGGYSASYSDPGVGVSIKLATSDSLSGPISQFEYTWSGDSIFWDLSNINGDPNSPEGYPFAQGGIIITPSMTNDPSNPTCVPVNCPAGTTVCTAAYNAPDDPRTMVCNQDSNLVLTICPGGSAKRAVELTRSRHQHQSAYRRHYPRKHVVAS